MKKSIIISIKPEWVEKILNGEKTIEIRKSMPKCNYPIDVYIYCTKDKNDLRVFDESVCKKFNIPRTHLYTSSEQKCYTRFIVDESQSVNGFIIAKFTLNETRKYQTGDVYRNHAVFNEEWYEGRLGSCNGRGNLEFEQIEKLLEKSCLTEDEIHEYAGTGDLVELDYGYFVTWHIDNLVIFDKPMELSDFYINNFETKFEYMDCGFQICGNGIQNYMLGDGYCYPHNCPKMRVSRPPQNWCYAWRQIND